MSMSNEESSKSKHGEGWAYLVAAAVVLALFVIIPALISSFFYMLLRSRLKKTEGWILASVGVIGIAFNLKASTTEYFQWLWVLVSGSGNRLDIPWYSLAMFTLLFTGIALALRGTRAVAWVPTSIGNFRHKDSDPTIILPTGKEKERIAIAKPPTVPLTIHSSSHSITDKAPIGKRSFPVGRDKQGAPVFITEDEIRMHGLIFGSTGSGKSETIKGIAGGLLDLGWDGMILDLKEDTAEGGLRDWCDIYAQTHALPYQEICLSDPNPKFWFNALAGMGLDEARDTILSMQTFEAAYYEAMNKQQLGQLLMLMYAANEIDPIKFPAPTLGEVGRILSSSNLANAVKPQLAVVIANTHYTKDDFPAVVGGDKNFTETARGLGARIGAENASQAGQLLLSPPREGIKRDLIDVTRNGITYIGLDSTGKVQLSRVISTAVLKRMSVYASDRISGKVKLPPGQKPKPRFLIVDEANFIDRKTTMALLSRARSSGIAMILCTQGPLDWRAGPGEPGVEELVQNTNVTIIMSQGERASAEICSDIIGRAERTALTQQMREGEIMDGTGSLKTSVEYLVSPDNLRSLEIGEAIIRVGKPKERVVWTKVSMRDPRVTPPRAQ